MINYQRQFFNGCTDKKISNCCNSLKNTDLIEISLQTEDERCTNFVTGKVFVVEIRQNILKSLNFYERILI